MKLLDLFCGAGGAAVGYHRAGFTEIVGVDIRPQPHYPFAFIQADALKPPVSLADFDLVHASPPCQVHTRAGHLREAQGGTASSANLVGDTRMLLRDSGVPYVIENVPGAPLLNPIRLCGSSFGLSVRRHRLFECSFFCLEMECDHKRQGRPVGIYHRMGDEIPSGGRTARTMEEATEAMGIDWMTWDELKESIPPAYTEYLGARMLEILSTGDT